MREPPEKKKKKFCPVAVYILTTRGQDLDKFDHDLSLSGSQPDGMCYLIKSTSLSGVTTQLCAEYQ